MPAVITRERPDSADAVALITELEAILEPLYPAESRHGFSVQKLIAKNVAFFVLRTDNTPAGCGGIQLIGTEYGEIKRMYVRPQFRGSGFGKQLLDHFEEHARRTASASFGWRPASIKQQPSGFMSNRGSGGSRRSAPTSTTRSVAATKSGSPMRLPSVAVQQSVNERWSSRTQTIQVDPIHVGVRR